jgi:hypothetical protein
MTRLTHARPVEHQYGRAERQRGSSIYRREPIWGHE